MAGDSNKIRILIVDDDQDCRTMLKTILENAGYLVMTAVDGLDALEVLSKEPPFSLIILDIMMPRMNGYDLAKRLSSEFKTLPIIMLTAKNDPEDLLKGYKDYGVHYYITKPFTTRQVLAGIDLVLS